MPRNGSGSYSLPEAAFIPNTAISSAAVNSDFSDIASALTASLARDGQGGMTAVLPLANLGFTYLNDPNTGMRRTAADTQTISNGGVDTVEFTSTTMTVTGTLNVVSTFKIAGVAVFPLATANIADNAVTYAKIQELAASRLLGNPTAGVTEVSEISLGAGMEFSGTTVKSFSVLPTIQRFTSGSGTYTTPANVKWIRIRMVGGGAGGGGGGSTSTSNPGGNSTFGGILTASGGAGASASISSAAGGAASGGSILNIPGGYGGPSSGVANTPSGNGGSSAFGGAGGGAPGSAAGTAGATNSGGGGGGGGGNAQVLVPGGGGAGGYVEHVIGSPAASYAYAVGAGGTGSAGAAGGGAGGTGAAGIVIVEEYY